MPLLNMKWSEEICVIDCTVLKDNHEVLEYFSFFGHLILLLYTLSAFHFTNVSHSYGYSLHFR